MPWYLTMEQPWARSVWPCSPGELLTGVLPALSRSLALADHHPGGRRRAPLDGESPLRPAIAAAVWITVGGLAMGVERTDAARLAYEVGPGVALVGLLCHPDQHHGRHRPNEPGQPL